MINEITLFDFQSDAVNYLLDATTDPGTKHKIILKSPTGSGKTVILLSYIDTYLGNVDAERVFIWLTPGKGNLEEQSEEKMRTLFPHANTGMRFEFPLQLRRSRQRSFMKFRKKRSSPPASLPVLFILMRG